MYNGKMFKEIIIELHDSIETQQELLNNDNLLRSEFNAINKNILNYKNVINNIYNNKYNITLTVLNNEISNPSPIEYKAIYIIRNKINTYITSKKITHIYNGNVISGNFEYGYNILFGNNISYNLNDLIDKNYNISYECIKRKYNNNINKIKEEEFKLEFFLRYFNFNIIGSESEISKINNKFNDLFENTSEIIKNLKTELDNNHEKIRNLEIEVHYLKSKTTDTKVIYDYIGIKEKNKKINNEFKRIYKLYKKSF